ncbi:PREDICTED: CD166 antigen-like, partial [Galeopterus variegatus]|uniref:CD166 antigen-like n=1 Tax=Galeopterus variegatus TaxID=482537 RepID=A0ABM0Q1L9_GALVR
MFYNPFSFLNPSPSFFFQTEESPYINGRYYSKIIISPEENVTLTCTAENQLERTVNSLNVSAISIPEHDEADEISDENREKVNDQAKLIVGIVVGLLLAALVAGIVYWLYMKKSNCACNYYYKKDIFWSPPRCPRGWYRLLALHEEIK